MKRLILAVALVLGSCTKQKQNTYNCTCIKVNVSSIRVNSTNPNMITGVDTTVSTISNSTNACSSYDVIPHWIAYSNNVGDANDSTYTNCH